MVLVQAAVGPAVYDGTEWIAVNVSDVVEHYNNDPNKQEEEQQQQQQQHPIPPILLLKKDDDEISQDSIFISIVSYRDGERCGATIKSIFDNAHNPKKVFIGLIEQNTNVDVPYCIEAYCNYYQSHVIKRQQVRTRMIKIYDQLDQHDKCPYYDNIRRISNHYDDSNELSKGPIFARSLTRKLLGNEQYCMQINSHTTFINDWDIVVQEEWKKTNNEFGILTTVPPLSADPSDVHNDNIEVPRHCSLTFRNSGYPDFATPADGKVRNITIPLLSHGWSSSFSFSRCHLEETVPYDPFLYGETSVEQFSRYIRLWTRGYDTYTPTTNVAYQNNIDPQNSTIGNTEWTIHADEKYRVQAINRAKMIAQIPIIDGTMVMIPSETIQANFGLYGLGKRRTLQQFNEFLKMDVQHSQSSSTVRCDDHTWVPYDSSILPTANLFNEPDNLDPQPIYPLRTRLLYYQQEIVFDADFGNATEHVQHHLHNSNYQFITKDPYDDMPSLTALASMWITGLAAWYVLFFVLSKPLSSGKRRKPKFASDQDALSLSLATSCKESDDGADKDS